jgi:hypothetical protein
MGTMINLLTTVLTKLKQLKQLLNEHKNGNIQTFLHGLTPTASTDYSLRKTAKKNLNLSHKLLHHFGLHEEHGNEAMLKKRKPSPITLPLYSNLTHLNPTPLSKPPTYHY